MRSGRTSLLATQDLTLDVAAKWIDHSAEWGSLPFVATLPAKILQRDAHTLAAALEGLHRRLYRDARRPLHPATRSAVEKARAKAADAAAEHLADRVDLKLVRKRFKEATVQVNDISYAERLEQLLPPVVDIAPGLCGPEEGAWFIKSMTNLRNEQSHHLLQADEFGDMDSVNRYYVLGGIARWILQLRLLLEVTTADQLHAALRRSSKFAFALAGFDREPAPWQGSFSAYHEFMSAKR